MDFVNSQSQTSFALVNNDSAKCLFIRLITDLITSHLGSGCYSVNGTSQITVKNTNIN